MNTGFFHLAGFIFLINPSLLFAEVVDLYEKDNFTYIGHAAYEEGSGDIRLTHDTSHQEGRANLDYQICAKEYKLHFEAFVGTRNASQGGGAGLVVYENRSVSNASRSIFEFNIQNTARPSRFNTVEMYSAEGISYGRPLFSLTGNGWHKVEYHFRKGVAFALVVNDKGAVSVANTRRYIEGDPAYIQFVAWTGTARNLHKIRNVSVEVIEHDYCGEEEQLSPDDVYQFIESECGDRTDCGTYEAFYECSASLLQGMFTQRQISFETYKLVEADFESRLLYCGGINECSASYEGLEEEAYERGFGDGKDAGYQLGLEDSESKMCTEEEPEEKVTICNRKPKRPVTLTIPRAALEAHLRNSATLGPC